MLQLLKYDQQLFKLINNEWHNAFFDRLMPMLRNSTTWVPFYVFFILFVLINYKRTSPWWLLFAVCLPIITDLVSSSLIKNIHFLYRLRPCNDPSLADHIRVLVAYRPQSSSFTSSHATNHFGIATFFYLSFKTKENKWPWLLFFWAFIISYAQVYVGVHYPLDVICGGLIGILIGYLCGKLFNRNYGLA